MAKKILFVGASLGGGGSERVMSTLANSFAEEDTVRIIRLFDNKIDYPIHESITTEFIGNTATNRYTKKIALVKALRKKVKEYQPDTIISFLTTCNVITVLACRGLKVKKVISERNDPNNNVKSKFAAKVRNIVYKNADCLVCQTEDALKYFPSKIQKKSVIIPNPVRDDIPEVYEGEREKNIIMVCRLNKQKNIPMALKAFSVFYQKHPEWRMDIYGEGGEKEQLVTLSQELGISSHVMFLGFHKDVMEKLRTAGIYLSTSDYEGISNSMLEAIALGTPCVVTDCPIGGARMVVKNGLDVVLIPVKEVDECVKALEKMADVDSQIVYDISINNSSKVKNIYSLNKVIEAWRNQI